MTIHYEEPLILAESPRCVGPRPPNVDLCKMDSSPLEGETLASRENQG
jgi:hypothetical protein